MLVRLWNVDDYSRNIFEKRRDEKLRMLAENSRDYARYVKKWDA